MRIRSLLYTALALSLFAGTAQAEPDTTRRFTIAYVNDIHAQLEPHPELFWSGESEEYVREVGGLARIAAAVKSLRAERPGQVIFVDGGDTIQGSGPAAWSEGRVVVEPMNSIGLDLAVPGNWSVAYGAEALKQRAAELSYPLLAANAFDEATGRPLFPSHLVREINGVRVGFIGFTEPDIPRRQPPFMSQGLGFSDQELLQPVVDRVRSEDGAEVVVLVTHIGLSKAVALAETLRDVDIVLSADTHERTYEPIRRGDTWVVEAGAFGSFLGVLEVVVDEGEVVDRDWRLLELRPERYPEDPQVKAVVEKALAPYRERAGRVLGHTSGWLARYDVLNSSIDQVIGDAVRRMAGTDIAVTNGYRFAPPVAPGPITEGDLWNWLPMSLPLKVGEVKGSGLSRYWERELENVFSSDPKKRFGGWLPRPSNLSLVFDPTRAGGERVQSLTVAGREALSDAVYTIASGSYLGAPEDRVHRVQCRKTDLLEADVHQAVRAYLAQTEISPETAGPAVQSLSGEAVIRSQCYMLKGNLTDANS